ncbi:hypothetical protein GF373_09945 [bacterium]|nr:hypothetical protein [bacterium]
MMQSLKSLLTALTLQKSWAILFWGWMIGVSMWLDQAPIENPREQGPQQRYSNFTFHEMQFEQRYESGIFIHVISQHAVFDKEQRKLTLKEPVLTQNDEKGNTVKAKGLEGTIHVSVTGSKTGLPSEFTELILTGNARAEGKDAEGEHWTVESSKLVFDNHDRRIFFPEKSTFLSSQGKTTVNNYMYDLSTKQFKKIPNN